jgi:hypothetical protein
MSKTSPAYAVLSQRTRRVFAAIEGSSKPLKVVRHIRRLLPLAFLSPRIVESIVDGSARAHLTVT